MIDRFLRGTLLSLVAAASTACATTPRAPQQLPPDTLFQRALNQLQAGEWTDAITLFERFVIQYPANPRVQEARLRLADAYFGKKEYITAANEYDRLANDYPAGPYADDARFRVCESYYRLSPKPQLDQQYTRAALDHCQSLITYYPSSDFAARAQEHLTDLRTRLAEKAFLAGEFYFKRNAYDSAIIYYDLTLRDYADTQAAPRALLRLYETYQILGYREDADAARARMLRDYPNSPAAKQLQEPAAAAES
ncbi:MAG: outer membrane protein assembly factor BamD [Gemmatimonadota bacterium]